MTTVRDALLAIATPAPSLGDYEPIHGFGWIITCPDGAGYLPRCARCSTGLTEHPERGMARHRLYRHWDTSHPGEAQ